MSKISIITITYNAGNFLEKTLDSVINQSFQDFEHIIIDGASNDNTLEIIEKYKISNIKLISEKDGGIYDAMNKGLKMAKGQYVWFINAGDQIAEIDAIQKINKMGAFDVLYSDTIMIDINNKHLGLRTELLPHKIPSILDWESYKMGMIICHQSFIVKKELAPFYLLNNLSADIDWQIKCLKKSKVILKYDGILSKYLEGGASHQRLFRSWKDRFKVLQSHFGFIPNIINHLKIVLRADWKNIFRISKYIK